VSKLDKFKYKLAQKFVGNLLSLCQKKNNYCDNPGKDCSGCNIYEMAKGNDDAIENWILKQRLNGNKEYKELKDG